VVDRFIREIDGRLNDAGNVFRVGTVTSVIGSRLVVSVSGASLIVSRLSGWTPAAGDFVLVALTQAGWVAVGRIVP